MKHYSNPEVSVTDRLTLYRVAMEVIGYREMGKQLDGKLALTVSAKGTSDAPVQANAKSAEVRIRPFASP